MGSKRQGAVVDQDELRLLRERVAQLEERSAELGSSEERLQILFEHAPDGYYLSDLKGTLVDGNAAAERITGYKKGELIGKSLLTLKLLSAKDLPKAASLLAKNALGQSTGPDEFTLTRKDRAAITVEISTRPVAIGNRRVVLGIVRDINERKRAERKLREGTKELQALYSLAEITERDGITLDELYQQLANLLPNGWQYPESACARIRIGDREFRTGNFAESRWKQSAPVKVAGVVIGTLDVNYLDERPDEDEGPFLKGERQLLDALAERLGRITERMQAQEELRLSEARLEEAQRTARVGSWESNLLTAQVVWSDELRRLFEITPETVREGRDRVQAAIVERIHPEDRARYEEAIAQSTQHNARYDIEYRIRLSDGSQRYLHSQGGPTLDPLGNLGRLSGTVTDITERKLTEQAQRASEKRYQTLFDETSDGIALADADTGTILDCNAALCRMVERDKTELLGQPQSILHPPQQSVSGASPTFQRHRTGTADEPVEDELIAKSGKLVPIEIRAARVEIEDRSCLLGVFRDISERKRVEGAIRESERRHSLVLEATEDGIFDVDLRTGTTHYSPRYATMLGYGPTELVFSPQSGTWEGLLHPDDKERALRALGRCLSGEIADYDAEFRLRTKAGDWCWIESRARVAERDPAGNPLRLVGAHTDITERKRMEEALRESEEHFRTLYEDAPIGLYRTAPDGSILMANAALVKMLGFSSQDELLERNLEVEGFELAHSRSQFLERVEKEETITGLESVWTRQDGTPVFVSENSRATRDRDGKTLFYDGTVTDITERKKAEDALRESEDQYRGLVDNVPGVIFTLDLGGKITFVSPRIRDMLGYESADVVDRNVLDLIPEEERPRAAESIQRGMTGEGIKHFETPMIRKSGERLILGCSFARVRRDGAVIGAQGTAVDITERKRMEEALRESERNARHRAEGLRLVGEVGAAITARLDLERLMQTLYEQCLLVFPVDTFYIGLYDAATDSVNFPFMQKDGERRTLSPRCLRTEPGLLEQVIRGRQTVYLPDAAHSPLLMVRQPGLVSQSIVAVPMTVGDRVIGVLSMQSQLPDVYSQEQIEMFERLAAQVAIAIQNSHLYEAVSRGMEATLTALGRTVEKRDPYTAGHQSRVTDLVLAIARKLEYGEDACSTLRTAGMLHDIGKLGVPAEILSKPSALSKIEFELIRSHPQAAYEILADIAFPGPVAEIVLQHHERHDGSGYPRNMSGDDILPEARILAVADVVEAMASHRPYRPALGMAAALDEIRAGRGTRYDPRIADACVALIESGEFSFQPASAD